ncbi:MAG: metal ABC transporter permease [Acidobacteriota bacterium]|nr:metal ABC transporter permease [Acidobacteriota bacterium]MDQ7087875.1 metal ABC transporter permease [Acidobacteriota bacterium]
MEFLSALAQHTFLQYALLGGLLASVGCGVMGTYVVVKRIGYLAGGIAHAVLGGMGVAYFFGAAPTLGALVAALVAALLVGWASLGREEERDAIIGALWASGMALGILFISRTPGYNVDLMSYLFGNILMISSSDLVLMAVLDAVILVATLLFARLFLAVCFDEQFALVRGVRVRLVYLFLLCLVALTVVLLVRVVGLILVIALLTLPAAIAGQLVGTVRRMMVVATALGALFTTSGLALSYRPDLPAGAVIVLLAGLTYLAVSVLRRRRRPE